MRRETTNRLRFVLEELIPPILKDSTLFRWLATSIWGRHIVELADFRRRAPFVSAEEYAALYRAHPRVHEGTDNSEADSSNNQAGMWALPTRNHAVGNRFANSFNGMFYQANFAGGFGRGFLNNAPAPARSRSSSSSSSAAPARRSRSRSNSSSSGFRRGFLG